MTSVAFRDENCPSASPDRGACDGRAKKTVLLQGLSVRSEPSVRPESLTDSSLPSPPPSPCPRARPLATTDTLPRSALFLPMQIKYPPPTTLTVHCCTAAKRPRGDSQARKLGRRDSVLAEPLPRQSRQIWSGEINWPRCSILTVVLRVCERPVSLLVALRDETISLFVMSLQLCVAAGFERLHWTEKLQIVIYSVTQCMFISEKMPIQKK